MTRPGFCRGGHRESVSHLPEHWGHPHTQASEENALGHRAQPWWEEGFETWEEGRGDSPQKLREVGSRTPV